MTAKPAITIIGAAESSARIFGCTVEQARNGYLEGAKVLDRMADKAERTGRKVNGYTAVELRAKAADQRARGQS